MAKKVGLKLTREVSLKVDWLTFAEKMFKSVTEGFKAFIRSPQIRFPQIRSAQL
jgi:hypothetical protein